ncbi:hypothetical protein FCV25MIE_25856 [Fagus crenata]
MSYVHTINIHGCVTEYFKDSEGLVDNSKEYDHRKLQGYKCVLSSKEREESMLDGSQPMATSTSGTHGNNTSKLGHQCTVVLIA